MIRADADYKYYLIFKFFWVIVLLPKVLQLAVFGTLAVVFMRDKWYVLKISDRKFSDLQVLVLVIHALAIGFSYFLGKHDITRVFAAINTLTISIIAVIFYQVYSRANINIKKVGKYCCINMTIMLIMLILYRIVPNPDSIYILNKYICTVDYVDGLQTTRFIGLLDYANLIAIFSIINIPFVIAYLNNKARIFSFLVFVASFIFVCEANSRTGEIVLLMVWIFYIYDFLLEKLNKKNKIMLTAIILVIMGATLVVGINIFKSILTGMLLRRQGSNSMRIYIYISSLKIMLNRSPFIGLGIKDLIPGDVYPYGSHSSYIGYFYKTGIVGGVIYLLSFTIKSVEVIRWRTNSTVQFMFKISFFSVLLWMILEDLDGTNWSICLFYIFMGIMLPMIKKGKSKELY